VRWPQWSQRAAEQLGIRSVLSLQLFVGPKTFGSLDLYSTSPGAFRLEDRVSALSLAAHVAVALVAAQERETMESALITRTTIGQAEGMLMQHLGIKPDQAFSTLVRLSQTRNIKLHQVAADIVTHGIRPELFA
jgi:GAF domain-containing protein